MIHERLKVVFITKCGVYENTEIFDLTPHSNGFVPCYKLRARAMNWLIKSVKVIKDEDNGS